MLSKFKAIFYIITVAPIFVYIIVAHLLVNFVPGALPLNLNSIIGYACIFVIVFGISNILKIIFVLKKNKILKEKLLNEAEKTNNKKLFMRYFMTTQSLASGIPIIGLAIFFLTGKIFPLYLFSILSIPIFYIIYKNNRSLVKKHFNE
jgi:hypothetical protein